MYFAEGWISVPEIHFRCIELGPLPHSSEAIVLALGFRLKSGAILLPNGEKVLVGMSFLAQADLDRMRHGLFDVNTGVVSLDGMIESSLEAIAERDSQSSFWRFLPFVRKARKERLRAIAKLRVRDLERFWMGDFPRGMVMFSRAEVEKFFDALVLTAREKEPEGQEDETLFSANDRKISEAECARIIGQAFDKESENGGRLTKAKAQRIVPSSTGARAFQRAWERAKETRPEMSKSGRPPGRKS